MWDMGCLVGAGRRWVQTTYRRMVNAPINVLKNGYAYIYVSNESNFPVYFDNLMVTHIARAGFGGDALLSVRVDNE